VNRRHFARLAVGGGLSTGVKLGSAEDPQPNVYEEPARRLPVRRFDVVVAGGGTAGVVAALAAARTGAATALVEGMMITKDHDAHMSTRNTVCCMGQGQAAGTAAALCAAKGLGTRELPYRELRNALVRADVHLEG
jgi:hypothetical protein